MRVALHAGQLLQPVPGGIGRYVAALLRHLPEAGAEVTAFAGRAWRSPGGRPAGPFPPGVAFSDLGPPGPAVRYELWHRCRRPRLRLTADVVHAPSLAVPPCRPRPLVVTVHDLSFLRFPQASTRHGRAFHRRGLVLARREAATVVVPSRAVAAELAAAGFDPDRVHVVPHGVETGPAPSPADVERHLADLGLSRPFVLFVGTLEPRKGVPLLLEAFDELRRSRPRLSLALAGRPGWGEPPRLDGPGVVVLGGVGDGSLEALYRSAGALALPSRWEGFGLPALEAMARGCPVVATRAGALPEVVGEAGLLVEAGDSGALREALASLLDDPERAARHRDLGLERARQFSWAASAAGHVAAYRTALARAGG